MSKSPLRRVLCQDKGQLDRGVGGGIIPERRRGGTAERDRMKGGGGRCRWRDEEEGGGGTVGEDGKLRSVEQTVVRILWVFFFFHLVTSLQKTTDSRRLQNLFVQITELQNKIQEWICSLEFEHKCWLSGAWRVNS